MSLRRRSLWIVAAVLAAVLIAAIALRGSGLTSRRGAWPMERQLALSARRYLTPKSIRDQANPIANSAEVIRAGMEHFADHCASCHANDGSGETAMGRAMFPPAPDMRKAPSQAMTDGELFYAIERGIPLTGMPAWGNGSAESEEASWALVRFIRHLPRLTTEELRAMEALNPRSPAEDKQKKDIDDFLSGKKIR